MADYKIKLGWGRSPKICLGLLTMMVASFAPDGRFRVIIDGKPTPVSEVAADIKTSEEVFVAIDTETEQLCELHFNPEPVVTENSDLAKMSIFLIEMILEANLSSSQSIDELADIARCDQRALDSLKILEQWYLAEKKLKPLIKWPEVATEGKLCYIGLPEHRSEARGLSSGAGFGFVAEFYYGNPR